MHPARGGVVGEGRTGTVFGTGGGRYHVRLDDGTDVEASLRGRLKQERRTGDQVVIGDRVEACAAGDSWTIERVAPRGSELVRGAFGGKKPKVVAANLDRVLVVVAAAEPDPIPVLIDRLLVVIEASGLEATLVINKSDLAAPAAEALCALYERVGYPVLIVSALRGQGMPRLAREACAGTSALIGPSGVGKSSLLNALDPALHLRVGELSRGSGRGRHTTVGARLIPLACGGLVADTPGFGDVGVWGVAPDDVERCFPELGDLPEGCRFRGCTHREEPDCAVRAAVRAGTIPESRYRSYVILREEAETRAARG